MKNKKLLIHPTITSRGFILVNENAELIKKIETTAANAINNDAMKLKKKIYIPKKQGINYVGLLNEKFRIEKYS